MPWVPELFSAPVLARPPKKWQRDRLEAVPYFAGLTAGSPMPSSSRSPETPCCTTRTRAHQGRAGVRGVRHRDEHLARAARRVDRGRPLRHHRPALLVQRALEEHGRVDVLVNNVGAVRLRMEGFLGTTTRPARQ